MERHLAATDRSISIDCADFTALIRPEPLLAWIVSDSLCPKLVNWSSSARIAFLWQTRLRTETGCFTCMVYSQPATDVGEAVASRGLVTLAYLLEMG